MKTQLLNDDRMALTYLNDEMAIKQLLLEICGLFRASAATNGIENAVKCAIMRLNCNNLKRELPQSDANLQRIAVWGIYTSISIKPATVKKKRKPRW